MRRILIGTIALASLALGTSGVLAQAQSSPPPVPNASGSQVTNPETYRATANQNRAHRTMKMTHKAQPKHHMASRKHHMVTSTGSIGTRRAVPVPNASGSQVTSPETYGATAYQYRHYRR